MSKEEKETDVEFQKIRERVMRCERLTALETQRLLSLAEAGPQQTATQLLREAQEELRLIRMKDTNAVYDPTLRIRMSLFLDNPAPPSAPVLPEPAELDGWWPKDYLGLAFVSGAKWWEFHKTGATMWGADREIAEREAERRYGTPVRPENAVLPEGQPQAFYVECDACGVEATVIPDSICPACGKGRMVPRDIDPQ